MENGPARPFAHVDAPNARLYRRVIHNARAKALGPLATFDLDVAMTSEREWGFYATVPGIATHQLVRWDGIDAVHVTSWEWDGHAAHRVERAFAGRDPSDPNGAGANGAAGADGPAGADDAGALW